MGFKGYRDKGNKDGAGIYKKNKKAISRISKSEA